MALVLIVGAHGQPLDPVAAELEVGGHVVLKVPSAPAALAAVHRTSPDAIIVAAALPDAEPAELCRQLRRAPSVTPQTPILIVGELASRDTQLAAPRARVRCARDRGGGRRRHARGGCVLRPYDQGRRATFGRAGPDRRRGVRRRGASDWRSRRGPAGTAARGRDAAR